MNDFFIDQTDRDILMHKDVHFAGSFPVMIEYYENEGKGALDEFELDRMEELFQIEEQNKISLSHEILSEEEKAEILRAKQKYQTLRNAYDLPPCLAQKMADLILSEDFEAEEEIHSLLKEPKAIPLLIQLIQEEEFYNPLFPGYGQAPIHAMKALGLFKAKEAIIPLFESLSKLEFFGQETAFQALFQIGDPAKEFLLNVLKKMPITKENENAAIALSFFKEDLSIVSTCLDLLFLLPVQEKPLFFNYLLLSCDEIQDLKQKEKLIELSKVPHLPQECKEEIFYLLKNKRP